MGAESEIKQGKRKNGPAAGTRRGCKTDASDDDGYAECSQLSDAVQFSTNMFRLDQVVQERFVRSHLLS